MTKEEIIAFINAEPEYPGAHDKEGVISEFAERAKKDDIIWLIRKVVQDTKHSMVERLASLHDECEWKYVGDEFCYYDTACGSSYQLMEGDLEDNQHKFCPYCGKKIKEEKPCDQTN